MMYTPSTVQDRIDAVLEQFGTMLDDAQLLMMRVTFKHRGGVAQALHSFNPYVPLWQDELAQVLRLYGQNRIISLELSSIKNPKEEADAH